MGPLYRNMTWEEKLRHYDMHNRDSRFSTDPNLRNNGLCGCMNCATTRKSWQDIPIPVNDYGKEKARNMASINLCERCGSMVTGNALAGINIRTGGEYESETIQKEVCPDCIGAIIAIVEAETDPNERAYRKPWKRADEEPKSVAATLANTPLKDVIQEVVREVVNEQRAIEGRKAEE